MIRAVNERLPALGVFRGDFGAVGQLGSIAVVERFPRTVKEILQRITTPEVQAEFEHEVGLAIDSYHEHRPRETLGGKSPNEVYFSCPADDEQPPH